MTGDNMLVGHDGDDGDDDDHFANCSLIRG